MLRMLARSSSTLNLLLLTGVAEGARHMAGREGQDGALLIHAKRTRHVHVNVKITVMPVAVKMVLC